MTVIQVLVILTCTVCSWRDNTALENGGQPFVLYNVQYRTQSEHFLVRSRELEDRTISKYDDSKCFVLVAISFYLLFTQCLTMYPRLGLNSVYKLGLFRRIRSVHPYLRLLQAVLVVHCLTAGLRKWGSGFCFPHQFEYVHFTFLI